jgi:hypothetical protein
MRFFFNVIKSFQGFIFFLFECETKNSEKMQKGLENANLATSTATNLEPFTILCSVVLILDREIEKPLKPHDSKVHPPFTDSKVPNRQ